MKKPKNRKPRMEYDRDVFRAVEISRAFMARNVVSSRPGKASQLIETQDDYAVYLEGVNVALGMNETLNYSLKTDTFEDAMRTGDTKVLRIFTEAAEDVRRAYEAGISKRAKHVISVIGAKLEREDLLGGLPTESSVKKRARELYEIHFDGEAYPLDDYKEWKEIIEDAGLGYLPKMGGK